ncbi:MAG: TrkH family potassium uptake protein [Eubacteriales bacterium]|nr:TrkH family potassium uptake protein [Eubacteriales bacterium]
MNTKLIGNYVGKILLILSVSMVPAFMIALFAGEETAAWSFFATIALSAAASVLLTRIRPKTKSLYSREGFVIVALSWVSLSILGALPFYLSSSIPRFVDALFETVSGFTTTGATILPEVENLPMSILYWRSFTHLLGGMGVLVFLLALAPQDGAGAPMHILRAESAGPTVGKLAPKLRRTARILYLIYIGMTLLELVVLLIGGMPFFDALTTALGTAGTGGFSIRNSSIADYSPFCQSAVAVFMFLFAINFNMYYCILLGDIRSVWKNSELRAYLLIVLIATGAITISTLTRFASVGEAIHHSFFQVSSIVSTTGFATLDYNGWPEFAHAILIILMFIGGCAGSTGGGMKVSRIVILIKSLGYEMDKLIHPHRVTSLRLDGRNIVADGTIRQIHVYFFFYFFILIISTLLLSLEGFSFKTNFSAVLACLNNIGPGMDLVGPACNYSFFSIPAKLLLILNMLIGRLEIFPILLLFAPSTWKRRS